MARDRWLEHYFIRFEHEIHLFVDRKMSWVRRKKWQKKMMKIHFQLLNYVIPLPIPIVSVYILMLPICIRVCRFVCQRKKNHTTKGGWFSNLLLFFNILNKFIGDRHKTLALTLEWIVYKLYKPYYNWRLFCWTSNYTWISSTSYIIPENKPWQVLYT